jgi:hypothetical protein
MTKKQSITAYVDKVIWKKLMEVSKKERRSVSVIVTRLIEEFLEKENEN